MNGLLLALFEEAEVNVTEHLPLVSWLILLAIGLLIGFFIVRPELWRRLWFQRIDPRPAALMRITFGLVVMVTFVDLLGPHGPLDDSVGLFLFTDEGMWLTDMARKTYGGKLATLWDAEHGFEHWYDVFKAMWGKFSILHFRSDPPFVWAVYTAMLVSIGLMILGVWTRWTTILAWILVESVYRYSPIFYAGGDTVVRVFLFLGMFARWGEAYSVDGWRRRRKAILAGATEIPAMRLIPAWPMRMMMLQLAIIYCATGLLKSGNTWSDGTALYYALNLDHFYRWPQMGIVGVMHYIGVLPVLVILVHWWEMLFPVGLIGVAVNAYERERLAGTWPKAAAWRRWTSYALFAGAWVIGAYIAGLGTHYYMPDVVLEVLRVGRPTLVNITIAVVLALPLLLLGAYLLLRAKKPRVHTFVRHWLLGKRFWLIVGFGMHIGIDLGMNVGTFANVMMAVYFAWLSGDEIDAFCHYVFSKPLQPGEGERPIYKQKWKRALLYPLDRLRFRKPGPPLVVLHHPGDASVRRAALLRIWDLADRLELQADPDVSPEHLLVRMPDEKATRSGALAGYVLIRALPGLWWMRGVRHIPGVGAVCGALALRNPSAALMQTRTRGWPRGGWFVVLAACGLLAACGPPAAVAPVSGGDVEGAVAEAEVAGPGWQKGQLHLHSNASGDSETPPADVARWYAEHDYDFIVFTDHNRITQVPGPDGLLVMAGIELTQNADHCEPPPEPGLECLLHVNGLFVGNDTSAIASVPTPRGAERLELYSHAIAVTEALGGVAMLNHPNFHYAADADLLAALAGRGLTLLEVANEAVDSNNEGDDSHPSTEALWDAVLSTGARVWGVATDDAHHYYDAPQVRQQGALAHVGDRGWVMVRAEHDPAAIRAALERGEFYSTSGVVLKEVSFDGTTLRVAVDDAAEGSHRFVLVGDGGKELQRERGREAAFMVPAGYEGYLRVVVTDPKGRKAWLQPVWPRTTAAPAAAPPG